MCIYFFSFTSCITIFNWDDAIIGALLYVFKNIRSIFWFYDEFLFNYSDIVIFTQLSQKPQTN